MPANVTDYSSPTNYTAVWIHHRIDSTLQGDLNSEVPASLSQDNARLGAWTLVFNGGVHPQADEVVTVVPTATNLDESRYELGELISSKAYVKSTTIDTVTTETAQGFQYVAALVGNGRNPNTAWVSGGGASITGSDIFATLTDGGTENWGIIFNGTVITGQSGTADYSGYDENGNPQFVDSSGNLYTRWRPEYVQDGATAYSVRKKLPDVTTTTTNPVTTIETSYYDFYEVQHTSASEIAAFSANVVLVIPQHIMQRNVTTAAGNMTNGSYTLDNMFIRMSPHMSAARLEQIDLYNNYGISTKLVPINFNVGADQVEISLNQIRDVAATVPADKDFLQYYTSSGQWENGPAITDDILEGTTNKFYRDTRVQDYLTANAYATESYVNTTATTLIDTAISNLVDGAPTALDTLNEIAAALGDDENLAATLTSQIANLSISDLSDTATTAPSLGESLIWDGSAWGPSAVFDGTWGSLTGIVNLSISDLSDTATTVPSLGESLVWDGSSWGPGAVIGGATISGTAPTAPETGEFWFDDTTTGYLYTWDNSSWVQLTGITNSTAGAAGNISKTATGAIAIRRAVQIRTDGTAEQAQITPTGDLPIIKNDEVIHTAAHTSSGGTTGFSYYGIAVNSDYTEFVHALQWTPANGGGSGGKIVACTLNADGSVTTSPESAWAADPGTGDWYQFGGASTASRAYVFGLYSNTGQAYIRGAYTTGTAGSVVVNSANTLPINGGVSAGQWEIGTTEEGYFFVVMYDAGNAYIKFGSQNASNGQISLASSWTQIATDYNGGKTAVGVDQATKKVVIITRPLNSNSAVYCTTIQRGTGTAAGTKSATVASGWNGTTYMGAEILGIAQDSTTNKMVYAMRYGKEGQGGNILNSYGNKGWFTVIDTSGTDPVWNNKNAANDLWDYPSEGWTVPHGVSRPYGLHTDGARFTTGNDDQLVSVRTDGTEAGTVVSVELFPPNANTAHTALYKQDGSEIIVSGQSHIDGTNIRCGFTNLGAIVGISSNAVSDGGTVEIDTVGGISSGHINLTPSRQYYANPIDGTFLYEPYDVRVGQQSIGLAISATEILIGVE